MYTPPSAATRRLCTVATAAMIACLAASHSEAEPAFDPAELRVARVDSPSAPDGQTGSPRQTAVLMRLGTPDHYRVQEGQILEPVSGAVFRVESIREDGRVDLLDRSGTRITIQAISDSEKQSHLESLAPAPSNPADYPKLPTNHRVKPGETLAGLAAKYYPDRQQGIAALRAANPGLETRLETMTTNEFLIVIPSLHETLDW